MSHPADAWMPFYHRDFLQSERVLAMPRGDRMLYLELLARQWDHGPLPDDPGLCGRLIGASDDGDVEAIRHILDTFFELVDGRRSNRRLAELLARAADRSAKARASAAVSVNARSANAQRTLSERSALRGEERRVEKRTGEKKPEGERERESRSQSRTPPPPSASPPEGVDSPKPFKPATSAAIIAWNNAWAVHREGEYLLLKQDAILLNKLGRDHGVEALAIKADALLADSDPWVWKNASPRTLAARWNQVGQAAPPPKSVAVDRMREQAAAARHEAPTLDFLQAAGRKRLTQ
jgi:uncharacterized protein YdaU (DUF1376 family)